MAPWRWSRPVRSSSSLSVSLFYNSERNIRKLIAFKPLPLGPRVTGRGEQTHRLNCTRPRACKHALPRRLLVSLSLTATENYWCDIPVQSVCVCLCVSVCQGAGLALDTGHG